MSDAYACLHIFDTMGAAKTAAKKRKLETKVEKKIEKKVENIVKDKLFPGGGRLFESREPRFGTYTVLSFGDPQAFFTRNIPQSTPSDLLTSRQRKERQNNSTVTDIVTDGFMIERIFPKRFVLSGLDEENLLMRVQIFQPKTVLCRVTILNGRSQFFILLAQTYLLTRWGPPLFGFLSMLRTFGL